MRRLGIILTLLLLVPTALYADGGLQGSGGHSPLQGAKDPSAATPTWAQVLAQGNTSGATNPEVTTQLRLAATSNQVLFQSGGVTGTLSWTPATSNKTLTLPNITGTAALIDGAQTFTSATWQGTAVAAGFGGTGQTTYATGDLLYASAATTLSKLATGASGTALVGGATPSWSATPTLTSLSLSATSNQLVLQSAGVTGTISWTPATSNKTLTIPNLTGTAALIDGGQTFTSAVWNGTAVGAGFGGTGQTSYAAGDLIYATAATTITKLGIGGSATILQSTGSAPNWVALSTIDHGALGGLTDDDHTQYALLAGRSGGQTLTGGTAASNDLVLVSTSNATKGLVESLLDDASTSTVVEVARVSRTTTGTAANGLGGALVFALEDSAGNKDVGVQIEASWTDATSTSEDSILVFKTRAAGAAAVEHFRVSETGIQVRDSVNTLVFEVGRGGNNRTEATGFYDAVGSDQYQLLASVWNLASGCEIRWRSVANWFGGTSDIGVGRDVAGVLKLTDGSTGVGSLKSGHLRTATVGTYDIGLASTGWKRLYIETGIDTTAGDAATINKAAGRFRKDATGTTFTLTNSYITANSTVMLTFVSLDATATVMAVAAGAGSATITFNLAPTGNTDVNFWVINND